MAHQLVLVGECLIQISGILLKDFMSLQEFHTMLGRYFMTVSIWAWEKLDLTPIC